MAVLIIPQEEVQISECEPCTRGVGGGADIGNSWVCVRGPCQSRVHAWRLWLLAWSLPTTWENGKRKSRACWSSRGGGARLGGAGSPLPQLRRARGSHTRLPGQQRAAPARGGAHLTFTWMRAEVGAGRSECALRARPRGRATAQERGARGGGDPARVALPVSGRGSKTCPRPSARPPCHSLSLQPMARPPVTLGPPLGAARGGRSAGAERAGPELND